MEPQDYHRQLETYHRASQRLHTWASGALALSLLRAALHSGALRMLQQPRTVPEIARQIGLEDSWAHELCDALYALHICERHDDTYVLAADFAALLAADAPLSVADTLGFFDVFVQDMAHTFTPPYGETHLSTQEQLQIAKGKWGTPVSPLARQAFQHLAAQMPEVIALWNAPARHLEVGCGAGRDLLCLATLYPQVHVTGVDVNAAALAYVEREAQALGLPERVSITHADIQDLSYDAEFHTILWSQIFFPRASRTRTLEVVYRALRPGGYLLLPLQHEIGRDTEQLRASPLTLAVLLQLVYRHWGLNPLPTTAIQQEAEAAGFTWVRLVTAPYYFLMLLRKP